MRKTGSCRTYGVNGSNENTDPHCSAENPHSVRSSARGQRFLSVGLALGAIVFLEGYINLTVLEPESQVLVTVFA